MHSPRGVELQIRHEGLRKKIEEVETLMARVRGEIKAIGGKASLRERLNLISRTTGLSASETTLHPSRGQIYYEGIRDILIQKAISGHMQERAPIPNPRAFKALRFQKRHLRLVPFLQAQGVLHVIFDEFGRGRASFADISKALRRHVLAKHMPSLRMTEQALADRINLLTQAELLEGPELYHYHIQPKAEFNLSKQVLGESR